MDFVTRGFHEMTRRESAKRRAAAAAVHPYPELSEYRRVENPKNVTFPDACPVCNAAKVSEIAPCTVTRQGGASYACGGGYNPKPQISTRYAVYWGACGVGQ